MKEKTVKSKLVFQNDFMDLYVDDILLPDQRKATRTYIKHSGAAAVLPITTDGKLVLTRQYRYPVHKISIDTFSDTFFCHFHGDIQNVLTLT